MLRTTPLLLLLLLLLLPLCHTANILLLCGIHGSRLFLAKDVATRLTEFGHDVTLFSPMNDERLAAAAGNEKFKFVTVEHEDGRDKQIKENTGAVLEGVMNRPSADMVVNMLVGTDIAWENMVNFQEFAREHFEGEKFTKLLEEGKFDLIVVEDSAKLAALRVLSKLDIPIIGLLTLPATKEARDQFGLPGLMNSEPTLINEISDTPPSLLDRIKTLMRIVKVSTLYVPWLIDYFKDDMKDFGDFIEYQSVYDVVFIMDHPAYSYPYLAPPNTFYLGTFHLQDRPVLPLPDIYTTFLENCPHKHTAYISFGSYLSDLTKFPKAAAILRAVADLDLCVVVKSDTDLAALSDLPRNKVLSQSWIPQKDLLGSGKIDLFISHCGNNGRLESLHYNVPLLCIPLWLDQMLNARLVKMNGFGDYILKEELTEDTFKAATLGLIENIAAYKEKIGSATSIVTKDPGAGVSALKFYTDLLLNNKKQADFLINKMIMKQCSFEINNLDIILFLFFAFFALFVGFILCLCRSLKYCYRKVSNMGKFKTE